MTHHDERRVEQGVEARLERYRPSGPRPGLRTRIVPRARTHWGLAAAAVLALVTVGLSWATHSVERQTAALLGTGDAPPETPRFEAPLAGFREVPR